MVLKRASILSSRRSIDSLNLDTIASFRYSLYRGEPSKRLLAWSMTRPRKVTFLPGFEGVENHWHDVTESSMTSQTVRYTAIRWWGLVHREALRTTVGDREETKLCTHIRTQRQRGSQRGERETFHAVATECYYYTGLVDQRTRLTDSAVLLPFSPNPFLSQHFHAVLKFYIACLTNFFHEIFSHKLPRIFLRTCCIIFCELKQMEYLNAYYYH